MLKQEAHTLFQKGQRVLILGMGGGYDVVCGLPLFLSLEAQGIHTHLASLTSTPFNDILHAPTHTDTLKEITPISDRPSYFPEGWLSRWISQTGRANSSIWCFQPSGVQPYAKSLRYLIDHLAIDGVIAVDGGVDSLLRGDEYSLASPLEDALTLTVLNGLDEVKTVLVTTAFGAERLDGISHAQALARIAALTAADAWLGIDALLPQSPEGKAFQDAVNFIFLHQEGMHQSVIAASLRSALAGDFGDQKVLPYTQNTPPWISPLMCLYWYFDLRTVASQNLYLAYLQTSHTFDEAVLGMQRWTEQRPKRGWEGIPI